uniref:Uncharacterized protein n=1 Tax=Rhizophora mucronata TaxID=61149 RepID=A0A2P2N1C5_RHIMU
MDMQGDPFSSACHTENSAVRSCRPSVFNKNKINTQSI